MLLMPETGPGVNEWLKCKHRLFFFYQKPSLGQHCCVTKDFMLQPIKVSFQWASFCGRKVSAFDKCTPST